MPRPLLLTVTIALAVCLLALLAAALQTPRLASACAFDPWQPDAYEADQARGRYNTAIEAASVNRLLPDDRFFALPATERGVRTDREEGAPHIPPTLLKAIAWVESNMTMASRSVPFDAMGPALISFDCGHGLMQVTTGMTVPLGADGNASERQASIATHFAYNIARGAQILLEKWNAAPEQRPVVGTDTDSEPSIIENWYYATWAYNGFTGPGSSMSNHPLDSSFDAWPRERYRCDGTQSRNRYPYQELVWGCMANPEERDGQPLWEPTAATLPDLTQQQYFNAMSVSNWSFPYDGMDIPTPQPAHVDTPPSLSSSDVEALLGRPVFQSSAQRVTVNLQEAGPVASAAVTIRNGGSGVLTWMATTDDAFLVLSPPAGVAVGDDLRCTSRACPDSELVITVNPTLLPDAQATGRIRISSPNSTAPPVDITVDITAEFAIGAPGTSRAP
ncbi:MAG: hypothetical protein WD734_02850 [Dehalococcoidia bacterium]